MVVAVDPDLDQALARFGPAVDHLEEPGPGGEDLLGERPEVLGERRERSLRAARLALSWALSRPRGPASSSTVDGLGGEGGVVGDRRRGPGASRRSAGRGPRPSAGPSR